MPDFTFNFIQINFTCCSRRNRGLRNRDCPVALETASDTLNIGTTSSAFDRFNTDISDTYSDFELVQSATPQSVRYPTLSRAKLRWVRATLAAVLRQRVVKAYNQLTRRTKHNKVIGVPDPAVSRLWGQTGNWLQRHKL